MRLALNEQQMFAQRIRELLTVRLGDIDRSVSSYFENLEREMFKQTSLDEYDTEQLRELIRKEPGILQLFVINPDHQLVHPNLNLPLNRTEEEFFNQAGQIIVDRDIQRAAESQSDPAPTSKQVQSTKMKAIKPSASGPLPSGWFTWYWGRGVNLIYWQQRPNGYFVGVTLERSRWMADLISALPDTPVRTSSESLNVPVSRIRLIDSKAQPVYQWGVYEPLEAEEPACGISMSEPLNAWRLEEFVPPERLSTGTLSGTYFNLGSGLIVATLGMLAVGIFFYREYSRDMREAGQRVSFVNQVSHELRTPLTNIRMYGDLLEHDLESLSETDAFVPRERLNVILSESQRLSRLIDNVLTFARQQKRSLQLKTQLVNVDDLIVQIVERSQPSLQQHGIKTELDLAAGQDFYLDADKIEQILCNLMTNVEKYAAAGKWMKISTEQSGGFTRIRVEDHGPGINQNLREQIFEAFWRGSEELRDAAGTGIGLTIARDLARLHFGDIVVLPTERGACFEVRLMTPGV